MTTGTFYVVGTPIGNLEDMTLRAMRILSEAEVIVCEDTRVTDRLLSFVNEKAQRKNHQSLFRLDENIQSRMIPKVINWLTTGTDVVLVTDAGMPTISDPGWPVVAAVRDAEFTVEVIPGPTALTTAVAASGMNSSRVWFMGFLPKKTGKRQELYQEMASQFTTEMSTMAVFYESPNRLRETLKEIEQSLVNSPLSLGTKDQALRTKFAVCGELTKQHERVIQGTVAEVLEKLPMEIKGEWVVVVGK